MPNRTAYATYITKDVDDNHYHQPPLPLRRNDRAYNNATLANANITNVKFTHSAEKCLTLSLFIDLQWRLMKENYHETIIAWIIRNMLRVAILSFTQPRGWQISLIERPWEIFSRYVRCNCNCSDNVGLLVLIARSSCYLPCLIIYGHRLATGK